MQFQSEAKAPYPDRSLLEDYWTEETFSEISGWTIATLRAKRSRREGPPWIKKGRQTLYKKHSYLDWLDRQEIRI